MRGEGGVAGRRARDESRHAKLRQRLSASLAPRLLQWVEWESLLTSRLFCAQRNLKHLRVPIQRSHFYGVPLDVLFVLSRKSF